MKKYLYMAVAAIAALSSCSNEDEIVATENGKGETTFFATMENDATTRVTLNGKTPSWESGDVISIDGHDYTAATDVATTGAFTGTGATESTHKAYYPASMYSAGTVTLPASYTYTADKFDMPMYAESTTNNLQFKNLCGVLAITVASSQMRTVSSIVVSSDQQMNGEISAITSEGVLTFASATLTDAEKKVTLTTSAAVSIPTGSYKTFYVPVPAGTHNPLKITVTDGTTTKVMTTQKSDGVSIARNKIYPIAFEDNAGPTTTGTAAIKGGGTVGWVQLWAGGPKFAEKNVGASSVTDKGTTMTFTDAVKEGADYVWGANWCTPSKEDLEHLMTAAKGQTDDKVTCAYTEKNSVYGFEFTGKTTGYESNSVFFPAQFGHSLYGLADYWSGTASGGNAWLMFLDYSLGEWNCGWDEGPQVYGCLVRPVLKN